MNQMFMRLAIEEAKKSKEKLACGVVIVKNGEILARAHNTQRETYDASAHAEINAIRIAGKNLGSKYLEGCTIYCTCEPCIMCLSAIAFSKIKEIVFGVSLKNVSSNNLTNFDIDTFLLNAPYEIEVIKNFMEDECSKLY